MFRLYDFECSDCRGIFDALVWIDTGMPPEKRYDVRCRRCGHEGPCDKVISLVAPYYGEKPWFPKVAGGSFDTVGQKPTRQAPMPSDEALKDATAVRDHFRSAEWKDAKREISEQRKGNAMRRKRAELHAGGTSFNLRRTEDRLPGDPKI